MPAINLEVCLPKASRKELILLQKKYFKTLKDLGISTVSTKLLQFNELLK